MKCEGGMRDSVSGGVVRVMDGRRVKIGWYERWWWKGQGSGGGGAKMVQGP